MKKIVLIGGGGHAKVIIDAIKCANEFNISGIIDTKLTKGTEISGIKVLGDDNRLVGLFKEGIRYAFIAIGSIGNCDIRKKSYEHLNKIGFKLPVIIHPKAIVARDVKPGIGDGTFIAAGVVINSGAKIGKNTIINTSSSIDHDCDIGDFAHIAPGVTLSGGVKVGDETHIGTGANVIQNIKIGKGCFIPAGALVRDDAPDRTRKRNS